MSGGGHSGSDVPDGRFCGFDDSCCGAQNERGAGELAKRSVLICGRNGAEEALEAGPQRFMRDPEFPEELFETSEQADDSSKFVAKWIADENLNTAIPNAPRITSGKVVAHRNGVAAVA